MECTNIQKNALCVSPYKSFVKSDGFDNYSTHVHPHHYLNDLYKTDINKKKRFKLPDKIEEDPNFYDDFENFTIKLLVLNTKLKMLSRS